MGTGITLFQWVWVRICVHMKGHPHPYSEEFFVHFLFLDRLSCSQLTSHICHCRSSWHGGSCDVHTGLPNHCQPRPCWLEALQLGLRLVLLVWLHTSHSKTQTLFTVFFSRMNDLAKKYLFNPQRPRQLPAAKNSFCFKMFNSFWTANPIHRL